jgi:GTP pyrophosphokinase
VTLVGNEGLPFEVQIRTWDMHHLAEYGVAAHWKYKQGLSVGKRRAEDSFAWVRQLLEAQQDTDAEEYIRSLKVDLFADDVFVSTPRGDILSFPSGATPIDYAYRIHSAIGNAMKGAKVNGRIVTLDYHLKSGDRVEVITAKNAAGPSRDWIKLAQTNEARSKIRQWFKKERREENVAHGRASFESELRHLGIPLALLAGEDVLPKILKKVAFGSLEDMYAAIGYGGASAQKCVNRIREELSHLNKLQAEKAAVQQAAEAAAKESPAAPVTDAGVVAQVGGGKKSSSGVVVEDIKDCLVKFAKCCTPVPGDDIVGFVTRSEGVSVHRVDCVNARPAKRKADPDRWVCVRWDTDSQNSYKVAIEIEAHDRDGLANDITNVLFAAKLSIGALNVHTSDDGYAKTNVVVAVRSNDDVRGVIAKLQQIQGVFQVSRLSG